MDDEDDTQGVIDSAILVFPPESLSPVIITSPTSQESGVVTAFISGPNGLACPDEKRMHFTHHYWFSKLIYCLLYRDNLSLNRDDLWSLA